VNEDFAYVWAGSYGDIVTIRLLKKKRLYPKTWKDCRGMLVDSDPEIIEVHPNEKT
jgi:hypothetical protein